MGRKEGWARLGQMGFPGTDVLEGGRKRLGRKSDVKEKFQWYLKRIILQVHVQMFPPPAPYTEVIP